MRTQAGRFDRQATIQYPVTTNVNGRNVVTWTPFITQGSPPVAVRVWGQLLDVLPSRSEEVVAQGLVVSRSLSRWRMRWYDGITSAMRLIVHDDSDAIYQVVTGPAMIGRKEMLEIMVELIKL